MSTEPYLKLNNGEILKVGDVKKTIQGELTIQQFSHPDFIIQLKGREVEENGLILIENNEVVGYGYTNLAFQESKIHHEIIPKK